MHRASGRVLRLPAFAWGPAICLAAFALPAAADVGCPMTIAVTQKLAAPSSGWTEGLSQLPTDLAGISVFEGPPEDMADLVPDESPKTPNTVSDIWELPPSERGYWLTCRYANTTVTLTRQLPKSVTHCEAIFEKDQSFAGGAPVARSAKCGPLQP